MKKLFFVLAAAAMIFVSCSKKKDNTPTPAPTPVKQTVLAGMDVRGMLLYGDVTYSYTYDTDYRLVNIKEVKLNDSTFVIRNLTFTYSDGHISIIGMAEGYEITYECVLDNKGRITELEYLGTSLQTGYVSHYTTSYTYDADGYLITRSKVSDDGGTNASYIWENNELVKIDTDGILVAEYETSDAPAQAIFNRVGYDSEISELCSQGCFGKLPNHMPSKRDLIVYYGGVPITTNTTVYTYTVENGRLATCQEDENTSFTFHWEER